MLLFDRCRSFRLSWLVILFHKIHHRPFSRMEERASTTKLELLGMFCSACDWQPWLMRYLVPPNCMWVFIKHPAKGFFEITVYCTVCVHACETDRMHKVEEKMENDIWILLSVFMCVCVCLLFWFVEAYGERLCICSFKQPGRCSLCAYVCVFFTGLNIPSC